MFWKHYSFCAPWSPCRKATPVRLPSPGPHLFGLQFKMDCFAFFFLLFFISSFFFFVNSHLSSSYSAASFSHPAILFSSSLHLICSSDLLGQRVWRKTDLHICSTVWPVRNKWALPQKIMPFKDRVMASFLSKKPRNQVSSCWKVYSES